MTEYLRARGSRSAALRRLGGSAERISEGAGLAVERDWNRS